MIEHGGVIEKITGNKISVRILQQSACSTCHAKGLCMAAESKEKRVDIDTEDSAKFRLNERVVVEGKESMGMKAVIMAFIVPLIILVGVLALAVAIWNLGDVEAAGVAIVSLAPYYAILYLLRNKMTNSFKFTIKKIID